MEICIISSEGFVAPFLRVTGQRTSEITGPVFNPSGDRMYFSSQRDSNGRGITYEVRGPFRGNGSSQPDPDPAPDESFTVYLQNIDFGTYLTEVRADDVQLTRNPSSRSIWNIVDLGDGRYHIINAETGRWLDSDGAETQVGSSSAPVADDVWSFSEIREDVYVFENISTGRFLDADRDARVRLWRDNNRDAQWRLVPLQR